MVQFKNLIQNNIITFLIILPTFVYAQTGEDITLLKKLNQKLSSVENTQANSLAESIKKEQEDLQNAIEEASPFVSEFIMKLACGNSGLAIVNHLDLNTPASKVTPPMIGMRGHIMGCLKIDRISDWQLLDQNVLKFTVNYRSLVSGETNKFTYVVAKQKNGQWLFSV